MKKQFDLEEFLADPSKKVVTKDGKNVRIICTDRIPFEKNEGGDYRVIGLVFCDKGHEYVEYYEPNGRVSRNQEYDDDLYFEVEHKRVPLCKDDLLKRIREGKTMWVENKRVDLFFLIVCFGESIVWIEDGGDLADEGMEYEEMMNDYSFADGEPCWKEVDA